MKRKSILFLIFPMFFPTSALSSQFYRCKEGKQIIFQQFPCEDPSEQTVMVENPQPGIGSVPVREQIGGGSVLEAESKPIKTMAIERSPDSHFYVEGTVNGQSVKFLIDTGATAVVLPNTIAKSAKLEVGEIVQAQTANGTANVHTTQIRELRIGNFRFKDVQAFIIDPAAGNIALLGMNVLDNFEISQKKDTMTLIFKK